MDGNRRSGAARTRRMKRRWQPRKKIRLPADAYLAGDPFLLTVCTAEGKELLTPELYGPQARESMLLAAKKTGAKLWCGVVMPDHVHLFVSALEDKNPLDVASCFKRLTTIAARRDGLIGSLWQRRIHDRGLRTYFSRSPEAAVQYVLDNPVRRGLVSSWDDWPLFWLHQDLRELV